MAEWVGRTLSKVRIERLIGRGGMAEVYLGTHTTLERPVAVKVLHAHLSEDPQVMARFRREAQAVAAMRHQNIVHVLDFDIVDGRPYIVMELLDGLSLADYLRALHGAGHSLPLPSILRLVHGIASALDYAHARGIVHRDVKPANVMIRRGESPLDPRLPLPSDAEAVLTDFGVAHMAGNVTQTASGTVLGTPAYMSPEQVRGEPVDGRSDVYSLGIIVYEMLAGRLPFESESSTPASLLVKHISVEPPVIPNTAPAIQAAVSRSLAKQPEARYATAGAFERDLAHAAGAPATRPESTLQSTRSAADPQAETVVRTPPSPQRRFPLRAVLIAGAVVLLLAVPAFLYLRGRSAGRLPGAAEPLSAPASQAALQPGGAETPLAALTAASDAVVCASATIADAHLSVILNLPAAPEGTAYAAWLTSADGRSLPLGYFDTAAQQPSLDYEDPDGRDLLLSYDRIDIAPIPPQTPPARPLTVPCSGLVDPSLVSQLRFLGEITEGQPTSIALTGGLQAQAVHFSSHQGLIVSGVAAGDLAQAKSHAEHVINIVEGSQSSMYGDWNGDGLTQNPGDDFGLAPYLQLLMRMLDPGADADSIREAGVLLDVVEQARGLAQRIAAADSLEEVAALAQDLQAIDIEEGIASLSQTLAGRTYFVTLDVVSGAP